jgi:hypothetical protein
MSTVRLTLNSLIMIRRLRSHTLISSWISDEQRVPSDGWKSNDRTVPLCTTKSNTDLSTYTNAFMKHLNIMN